MGFQHLLVDVPNVKEKKQGSKHVPISLKGRLTCDNCTLNKEKMETPKMVPSGANDPVLYFIGDSPSDADDDAGIQFQSHSAKMVRGTIPSRWKSKIRFNNVIRCRVPRAPSALELECCRKLQIEDIAKTKPKAVVCFGGTATQWFLDHAGVRDVWRGRKIAMSIGGHSFWLYPMLDTFYLSSNDKKDNEWERVFLADLKRVYADADEGFDKPEILTRERLHQNITIPAFNVNAITKAIKSFVNKGKGYGFDIETKNLVPYYPDSNLLTAAFGNSHGMLAYPIGHPEAKLKAKDQVIIVEATVEALTRANYIFAHNAAFEQEWLIHEHSREITRDITWRDSMAQAYVLDEREGAKGLDEVMLILFGGRIKPFYNLDMNNLDKEPLSKVLPYNGVDAVACLLAGRRQDEILGKEGLLEVSFFHERRAGTMALLQSKGMVAHPKNARKLDVKFSRMVNELADAIFETEEVKKYQKRYGTYNPNTPNDVKKLFNAIMGNQLENTEESTLSTIKHPLVDLHLEFRTLTKNHSTYIKRIASGEIIMPEDGRIHARYTLFKTRTGRPASENPNMQNFPKREHREIRGLIGVPDGHYMVAFDYGQIEARVIGMASLDKELVDVLWTGYDIHQHWAERILKAYPRWEKLMLRNKEAMAGAGGKVMKALRNDTKNQWTFPNFFGAQLYSISGYLGIPERVLEPLFEEFWKQFSGVKKWQDTLLAFYRANLYVETLTHRRRRAPMSPNEAINMPIQGTATDIVVDGMERLNELSFERDEPWLSPVFNGHDDLTFYIPKKKVEAASELIGKTMCCSPYKFINVPLTVEMSITDESWDKLEDFHVFSSVDYGRKRK